MVAGSEARRNPRVSLTTGFRLTRSFSCSPWRLKVRIWLTSCLARWAAVRICSTPSLKEGEASSRMASNSELPMMTLRMLLKSCAIPPARVPIASIFWTCLSCVSRFVFLLQRFLAFRDVAEDPEDLDFASVLNRHPGGLDVHRLPAESQNTVFAGGGGPALFPGLPDPFDRPGAVVRMHQLQIGLADQLVHAVRPEKLERRRVRILNDLIGAHDDGIRRGFNQPAVSFLALPDFRPRPACAR